MKLQGIMKEVFHCNQPEVLIEGPAGTGKTWTDHLRTIALCNAAPGSQHLYTRQVRADMSETVLKSFEQALGENHPIVANGPSRENRRSYDFPNGSRVVVAGLDRPERTYSGEYDTVTIFEATDVPEDSYERLFRTLRGKSKMPFKQIRIEVNPDSPMHWINRRFVGQRGAARFKTKHKDNPYLWDEDRQEWTPDGVAYVQNVLERLTGYRRRRLLDGEWCGAEGMIYEEWDQNVHVVDALPAGWETNPGWRIIRSIDFGFTNPFVCQWWARDPDGRMYLFRERVLCEKTTAEHAPFIAGTNRPGKDLVTVADPENAEGMVTLQRAGVGCTAAEKAVLRGIESVKNRLKVQKDGKPRLFVLRSALVERCPTLEAKKLPIGLMEEIVSYVWEPPKEDRAPKEEPKGINDHSMDAMRYASLAADAFEGVAFGAPPPAPKPDVQSPKWSVPTRPASRSLLGERWKR